MPPPDRPTFANLVALMHRLRSPGGCPWDAEQTHASLKPYAIEEAHEVCEAIDRGSDGDLAEELGDILLQVIFHAELAAERRAFTIEDVIEGLASKLIRRHPHVFGNESVGSSQEVRTNWSRIKARERQQRAPNHASGTLSALDSVPRSLPSLLRAHRLAEKAGAAGFDWPTAAGAREKIDEELAEVDAAVVSRDEAALGAEIGDVLFAASSFARLCGLYGVMVLHAADVRFVLRFRELVGELENRGKVPAEMAPGELEASWQRAKVKVAESATGPVSTTTVRRERTKDP
jgi:tetrapyrrole methylase family protein/MazG family protein